MFGPKRGIKKIVLATIISALILYFVTEYNLRDSVMMIAKSKTQLIGQEIIYKAVNERAASTVGYQDMVSIHKDNEGRIVLLQPNTVKINRVMAGTVLDVEKDFEKLEHQPIAVPMGQALGSHLFSACGPKINVKIVPASRVNVEVLDHFKAAGINQSRHLISLKVSGKIRIVVPFEQEEITVGATVPIAETVIVGQVPESYMNFTDTGELFRLKGIAGDNK